MSEQTYEAILKREMARVPGDLDTREGSLIWYANAPGAVELVNLNIAVEEALNNGFADTASRKYLIRRAAERGLSPQAASAAILELTTTPAEIEISLGTRFSIGALNYAITKRVAAGVYEITCETPGEAGNDYSDTCIPIEYVKALRPAQSPLCSFRAKTKKLPKYSGSATSAVSMRRLSVEIGRTTSKRSTPSPVWVLSRYIGHGTQTLHLRVFSRRKVRMHGLKPFPAYRKK